MDAPPHAGPAFQPGARHRAPAFEPRRSLLLDMFQRLAEHRHWVLMRNQDFNLIPRRQVRLGVLMRQTSIVYHSGGVGASNVLRIAGNLAVKIAALLRRPEHAEPTAAAFASAKGLTGGRRRRDLEACDIDEAILGL
ncbi:MAG: hypothetical protein ABSE73_23705, partial [Planctomycetota bacterium]